MITTILLLVINGRKYKMQKKELTNIPGMEDNVTVTIWKMNYGFKSDLQGDISSMSVEQDGDKTSGRANMDITKLKILNLVYGIYESAELGINSPKDLGMGLSTEEKTQRTRAIRCLDLEAGAHIFKQVGIINKDNAEENKVIKKN